MEGEKVKVITAGGAASSKKKKKRSQRSRKSKKTAVKNNNNNNNNNVTDAKTVEEEASPAADTHSSSPPPPFPPSDEQERLVEDSENNNDKNGDTPANSSTKSSFVLELEESERDGDDKDPGSGKLSSSPSKNQSALDSSQICDEPVRPVKMETLIQEPPSNPKSTELFWLFICFVGIMASFVVYGVLLEYATSDSDRNLHELSFLFVTSSLYTVTAAAGRYVRAETPTTIPPARFAILGLTSMGSTFCSVRSLRYVIYPIQVLAKSCKPVPVMLIGALMGKKYSLQKYINVTMIVLGVALFTSRGGKKKEMNTDDDDGKSASSQLVGIVLLFVSLCFDGGTGAYEDKLMSVHSVQPFDLMYNIQLGKTILAGVSLLVLNQVHVFVQMCADMGFILVALGLSGAVGQVFIFVTIAKFGALTCSIIGLARKITTLLFSIWYFGHLLSARQIVGLLISVGAMVMNFMGKKGGSSSHGHSSHDDRSLPRDNLPEDMQKMLSDYEDEPESGDVELATRIRN